MAYQYVPLKYSQYYNWKGQPSTSYPKNQGILSVEADSVAFDPVKADNLAMDFDPVSKEASQRVASRYKNYKDIALLPEQAAEFNQNLESYRGEDSRALNILKDYQSKFKQSLAARDVQEGNSISKAQTEIEAAASQIRAGEVQGGEVNVQLANVRVTRGGTVEASYAVPQEVADALAGQKNLYTSQTPEGFNVDVRAHGGHIVGQELHEALQDAQAQTQVKIEQARSEAANQVENARRAAEDMAAQQRENFRMVQYQGLANAINESRTQRNISVDSFDQEFSQGLARYNQIGQKWGTYLNGIVKSQTDSRKNTQQSISQLNKSGILNYSLTRG